MRIIKNVALSISRYKISSKTKKCHHERKRGDLDFSKKSVIKNVPGFAVTQYQARILF